jgi:beta-galactosidase
MTQERLGPAFVCLLVAQFLGCGGPNAATPGGPDGGVAGSSSTSSATSSGTSTRTPSSTASGVDASLAGADGSAPSPDAGGQGTADSGATTVVPPSGRARTILPFDASWLFHYGDAAGANASAFQDAAWRTVNVPHDWAIEGPSPPSDPFSQTAATTGRGAYVASGVSWYRRHFTLPQDLSGRRVYIEFDGVMANSDVYINGTHLGHHPYGYVGFRYDMTSSVQFGTADNVVAVKVDTTVQPAERFYAGAGIYRHVRLLATDPVHVDQYATFVTTPSPTTASATVHVTSTVVNGDASAQSVALQGIVSDPNGAMIAPVTTAAQSIAAGASASFAFDVIVPSPKLWDLTTPVLYHLALGVQVGGTTVDDDAIDFGIRELAFNNGMTLNGKSVKFQGVAIHQDYHGLGMAAPQRAMQRRLAQLQALGVNAIRTAHDPPSPDFLDLTDRMGFLVLDEFADVWTAHKYTDVGDYAAYFKQTATAPTGLPGVPPATGVSNTGAPWWQVDLTGFISRDRNHPSVALYSLGNEIHDSLATRTPILTQMIAIGHALDPSRDDTQALLDPATAGDVGGATNKLLDVWGDNYDVPSCLSAMTSAPTKSGLLTEMGTETSTWATVTANPGLIGEFMWTGVDYLGEADGKWPTVGSTSGLMDALGGVRSIGYSWQTIWGAPKTSPAPTGTTATQLVVSADHTAITTDGNDASFVRATIADQAGHVVATSAAPVTFAISGPGAIVAVDSASMTQETFRGSVRNGFQGLAYAIVQATGPGTIVIHATSPGLTGGQATVQANEGAFVPCSGTCD